MRRRNASFGAVRSRRGVRGGLRWIFCLVCLWALPAFGQAAGADKLKRARDAFEYGDFQRVIQYLKGLPESGLLPYESDRIESYRLLGLSQYFLGRRDDAEASFFGLLKQDPDHKLDPFYVPPDAVAFLDEVRNRNEKYLSPIRDERQRRLAREKEDEAARLATERARLAEVERLARERADRELERERLRNVDLRPRLTERTWVENSRVLASLPFGFGQFQNGDTGIGSALAVSQAIFALVSVAAYVAIEAQRDPATGGLPGVQVARVLDLTKWISGGLFYATWLGGAVDAHMRFVPRRLVGEETTFGQAPALPVAPASPAAPATPGPVAPPVPSKLPSDAPAPTAPPDDSDDRPSDLRPARPESPVPAPEVVPPAIDLPPALPVRPTPPPNPATQVPRPASGGNDGSTTEEATTAPGDARLARP